MLIDCLYPFAENTVFNMEVSISVKVKIQNYVPWVICLAIICTYRSFIIKDYACRYADEDQAIMWYGTALASSFKLAEPHFLGQAYGSMIESIVAVPFYRMGIPLSACLPLATFILWISPFVMLSLACLKRNRPIFAYTCLLLSILCNWDYDILTAIPRSFIGGYLFAFIGILLLERKSKMAKALSAVLMCIAFINTETTITVSALGVLHYVLWNGKQVKKDSSYFALGGILGLVMIYYCNIAFYKVNPEYNLHGSNSFAISFEALKRNLGHLNSMLSSFSFVNIRNIPVFLIAAVLAVLILVIRLKKWKNLLLILCAIGGSMSFLALPKTLDYVDSLLFSQSRMFLFIPYVMLSVVFYLSNMEDDGSIKICITRKNAIVFAVFVFFVVGAAKTLYFERVVLKNGNLYSDPVISVKETSKIYQMADKIREKVEETGTDTVIFQTDNRVCGYATSAINYDAYLGYNAFYDRRTPSYLYLKDTVYYGEILMVESDGEIITNMHTEKLNGITPIDWLREQYSLQRYPGSSRFYIHPENVSIDGGVRPAFCLGRAEQTI